MDETCWTPLNLSYPFSNPTFEVPKFQLIINNVASAFAFALEKTRKNWTKFSDRLSKETSSPPQIFLKSKRNAVSLSLKEWIVNHVRIKYFTLKNDILITQV